MDSGLGHCTGDRDEPIPMEKKFKEAKWLSEVALQMAVKRREVKAKEKRKDIASECRVPKNSKKR